MLTKGQIFDAFRISMTRVSAPKKLESCTKYKHFLYYKMEHLFGAETRVAEI
jgi:hypothetical protein